MEAEDENQNGDWLELRQGAEALLPTFDAEGEMTFAWRSPGSRYFLQGEPVHAGDVLELLLDDGQWQPVRFEWSAAPERRPIMVINQHDAFALPDQAIFRWSQRK